MTNAQLFEVTVMRLRDLPGLPEESLQDLMALRNLYAEARRERQWLAPCDMCDNGDGHLRHACPRVPTFQPL